MRKTWIKDVLRSPSAGSAVTVDGWVRTRRDSKGGFSFVELNDGSCQGNLQIIVDASCEGQNLLPQVTTGASVRVEGDLVASPGKEQAFEVKARKLHLFGTADPTFPLQKKKHSYEFLRTIAHLRPRSNTFGAVFRVRNALSWAIHKFFQERGFMWVHTPVVTGSDCEGAGAMFRVTTLDPAAPPRTPDGAVDYAKDFFGKSVFLTVSGQLEVETFVSAFSGVYTFGPTFRAENSNTPRHLAEFWMVEPEIAFADLNDDYELAVDFLKSIFGHVLEHCPEEMAFFDKWIQPGVTKTVSHVVESPFEKITYDEAIKLLEASGKSFEFPVKWGVDLQAEHERYLTEEKIGRPVAVVNYPKEIKAFYMHQNDDGKTVAAMDILVPRIGEIIGGSQREARLDVLERRIAEAHLDAACYQWYLDLRRYGSVPHAGFGLGLERAILYVTGMANIRDVIPFARATGQAEF